MSHLALCAPPPLAPGRSNVARSLSGNGTQLLEAEPPWCEGEGLARDEEVLILARDASSRGWCMASLSVGGGLYEAAVVLGGMRGSEMGVMWVVAGGVGGQWHVGLRRTQAAMACGGLMSSHEEA